MRISTKGRYAVRAVLELGLHYDEKSVLLKDIARRQDISEAYLELLMSSLRKSGLVTSIRGAHGGYRLAKHPSEINLAQVVEAVEGSLSPVSCLDESTECPRFPQCAARDIWMEVGNAIRGVLEGVTVEDFCNRQREKEREQTPMYYI